MRKIDKRIGKPVSRFLENKSKEKKSLKEKRETSFSLRPFAIRLEKYRPNPVGAAGRLNNPVVLLSDIRIIDLISCLTGSREREKKKIRNIKERERERDDTAPCVNRFRGLMSKWRVTRFSHHCIRPTSSRTTTPVTHGNSIGEYILKRRIGSEEQYEREREEPLEKKKHLCLSKSRHNRRNLRGLGVTEDSLARNKCPPTYRNKQQRENRPLSF